MLTRRSFLTAGLAIPALASIVGIGKTNAEAKEHQVEIQDFGFNPSSLNVKPGDSIVFINRDIVPHTATEIENGWDSGDLKQGDQWVIQ